MRALFAHDNIFQREPATGEVYTETAFPYALWTRYLQCFEALTVVGREGPVRESAPRERLMRSSGPGVSFVLVPSLSNPVAAVTRRAEVMRQMAVAMADVDAVIARLPSEIGSAAVEVAVALGKPWAAEVVGCAWDALWNHGSWMGKAYAPVMEWRTRRLVAQAPFAIYVTERFLQERYPCPGVAVGCSDVEMETPAAGVLEARLDRLRRLASGAEPVRLGLIGALSVKYKGLDVAMRALARVRERLPRTELHVLGGGDAKPWQGLARRLGVEGAVFFDGVLPTSDVPGWLDRVDVYLQPSRQEGLPRALVEAQRRGCPALGSSAGGIPELLELECLHTPGDSQRLSVQLERALGNVGWLEGQAVRNFEHAQRYARPVLEARRARFWQSFRDAVGHAGLSRAG